jgi:death-on-curing protein
MDYLSKKDIIYLNKLVIERYGGNYLNPFNLLNELALDYLVEIVEHGVIFGEVMYPTIESKAALYLFNITENHIFSDENKRTGLLSLHIFLNINGFRLKEPLKCNQQIPELPEASDSDTILEKLIFEVAESKRTLEELSNWIKQNITAI